MHQISYFNILIYGAVISLVRNSLSCYFSGIGRTKVVMVATLGALVVNVVLDYVLIFGKFGLPAMGIEGAAIATLCGSAVAVVIFLMAYLSRYNRAVFAVGRSWRLDWGVMRKLVWFGLPAGVEMLLNFMAFSAMIMLFHSRGMVVGTASTIMFNWDLVTFIPLLGIEIAVTSLVGRYMGAGQPALAQRSAISAIFIGIGFTMVVFVFFVFFPNLLVELFRPNTPDATFDQSIPLAVGMIRLASLYVLSEAVMVALVGALRGAGDTHFTMILSVSAHWLFVPVLYVMFNLLDMSALMGWLALVIIFLLFCVALIWRFRSGKWKKIKVVA
ncbi:MATE family multidrug resistance protein [Breznakibacter xylanolyticus]|uniref:MATE family multidrug resistance protein n=1 Tax=Breznakibacter xylanolyticus TaxID=990 RepID=A0A2W7N9Z4_9BACT|nr:MATE family efflux transporter [Breznakibacter xylanolyticus]PZX14967.1 MATE family multidrug resistance protein [Breznakibacter xylanolyticus]